MNSLIMKSLCATVLVILLLTPPNALPCAPTFPKAVFTFQRHPDAPLKRYAQGELGVILPSFARSYLVIAYRHLSDRPLSADETKGILKYWRWKLAAGYDRDFKDPNEQWLVAREHVLGVLGVAPPVPYKQMPSHGAYLTIGEFQNCGPDAFQSAAATLNDRIRRFGLHSSAVREWLAGQDAVFSNCSKAGITPASLPAHTPGLIAADRRYQIAAAHFYAGDHLAAVREFDQVARDKTSPWRFVAPYLAARATLRRASLDDAADALDEAEARLKEILKDKSQAQYHRAARRLLGYIAFRRDPVKRTHQLGRLLAVRRQDPEFQQSVIDYTVGLDRVVNDDSTDREIRAFAAADEMTDWILSFQQQGHLGAKHAVLRWQQRHSLPWLVAAISMIKAQEEAAPQLMEAAAQIAPSSPAYPTLVFHRVRLLMDAGKSDEARTLIDEFVREFAGKISLSSLNLFLERRLKLVTSFEDFLTYVSTISVGDDSWDADVGDDWFYCGDYHVSCDTLVYGSQKPIKHDWRFDDYAKLTLDQHVPLSLLGDAVLNPKFPAQTRGELAISTWTRAVLLGEFGVADRVLAAAKSSYPETAKYLDAYAGASGDANRWHAALFAILHFPGMRPYVNGRSWRDDKMGEIDGFHDNWWCWGRDSDDDRPNNEKQNDNEQSNEAALPSFLSDQQLATAGSQWDVLTGKSDSDVFLPREVLKWAAQDPGDPRIPEALHYAVRVTRFGCSRGAEVSSLSRRAYSLLQRRYPNSRWADETPYWY
ncbi:MAG TPA: hypothetical protein VEN79_14840 [Terriglobia bacterium]|nr:hypothetical protein [Terriglobia bacterium]